MQVLIELQTILLQLHQVAYYWAHLMQTEMTAMAGIQLIRQLQRSSMHTHPMSPSAHLDPVSRLGRQRIARESS